MLLAAIACGDGASTPPDASIDAAADAPVSDAALPPWDATGPDAAVLRAPTAVWTRLAATGEPRIYTAAVVGGVVLAVTDPDLVLYDGDGVKLGQATYPNSAWSASEPVASGSDAIAVAFAGPSDGAARIYDRADLSQIGADIPLVGALSGALVATETVAYALILENTSAFPLRLFRLDGTGTSLTVSEGVVYSFAGPGLASADGRVLFCAGVAGNIQVLRIDPGTGSLDTTDVLADGSASSSAGCRLRATASGSLVTWSTSGDGGSSLAGALLDATGETVTTSPTLIATLVPSSAEVVSHGGAALAAFSPGDAARFRRFDVATLTEGETFEFRAEANEEVTSGIAVAADADALYLVMATATGFVPAELRVHRLALPP